MAGPGPGVRRDEVFGLFGPGGATVGVLRGHRLRDGGEVPVSGAASAAGGRAGRSRAEIVRQDESAPAGLTVRPARAGAAERAPGISLAPFLFGGAD